MVVSTTMHPSLDLPFLWLHPCATSERMGELLPSLLGEAGCSCDVEAGGSGFGFLVCWFAMAIESLQGLSMSPSEYTWLLRAGKECGCEAA